MLLGWDKLAPESMALYQSRPGYYRVASKPAAEARTWMIAVLPATSSHGGITSAPRRPAMLPRSVRVRQIVVGMTGFEPATP